MISLDLGNIFIDHKEIESFLHTIYNKPAPSFTRYKEDIPSLKATLAKYKNLSRLLIIGTGGSINSFKTIYGTLGTNKNVAILDTNEPDTIEETKRNFPKKSTLVMPISKSGASVSVIETLFAFDGYTTLPITGQKNNPLRQIAKKKKWNIIDHPEIGGRYAGISSCAYAPLLFMGIDVRKIDNGAKAMYKQCSPKTVLEKNPALQLSLALFLLELKGYSELFVPVYSIKLTSFLPLIIQLMHESVCKNGQGQTVFGDMAPEAQHHTIQRFFGGKKNVIGLFIRVKEFGSDSKIKVPKNLQKIVMRDGTLKHLDKLPFSKALNFEFLGVREHTIHDRIPYAVLTVDRVDESSVGEFMAFWHYVAVYSAWLRNVDPFNQPEVEFSKQHSFELRKKYHR